MKRWCIVGLRSLIMIGLAAITALGLVVCMWYGHGGRMLSVQTNSMNPAFRGGDGVMIQRVAPQRLRAGDVVSYRTLSDVIISHRIVSVQTNPLRFTTRGDNASQIDPPLLPPQLVGRVAAVAPNYGRYMHMLRSPIGLSLAVYIPGAIVIFNELTRYSKRLRHRAVYRLYPN